MGLWGFGPMECDDAGDFLGHVRDILEEAWTDFSDGDDARGVEAAAIVLAFGKFGIDVVPEDADELADLDGAPEVVVHALTTEWPRVRPAFGSERAVEEKLRQSGAPYELWNATASYGDDHDACWRGQTDPDLVISIARAYGIDAPTIRRAIASAMRGLATVTEYADAPFRSIDELLANAEHGRPTPAALIESLTNTLREYNMKADEEFREALNAGKEPAPRDRRLGLLSQALHLANPHPRAPNSIRPVAWLVEDIPDLAVKLRSYLDPFFAKVRP